MNPNNFGNMLHIDYVQEVHMFKNAIYEAFKNENIHNVIIHKINIDCSGEGLYYAEISTPEFGKRMVKLFALFMNNESVTDFYNRTGKRIVDNYLDKNYNLKDVRIFKTHSIG